jgi:hypothetical protein
LSLKLNAQERKVIIIGLLSLVVAAVTYGVLSSSGTFRNEAWNLGGAIVGFLASVFALNNVYGKSIHLSRPKREHSSTVEVEVSPPSIKVIDGSVEITDVMIQAVLGAQKYIYTIGGKSRDDLYLDALRDRASRGDIRYIRVITGNKIQHALCRHLHEVSNSAEIGYFEEDTYGNVLVTHNILSFA